MRDDKSRPNRGIAMVRVGGGAIAALLSLSGWATVQHSWSEGLPWWAGFRAEYLATPIAALIAAVVAITTAWWGVANSRATREVEHERWEKDRATDSQRVTEQRREATERTLRDRFHELIKLLSANDLRSREGASYALAALADDWEAHYGTGSDDARAEQQVCIDVLISQLRDPIHTQDESLDSVQQIAFKQVVQKIISSRLVRVLDGRPQPGPWSDFDLVFDGCYLYDFVLQDRVCAGAVVSFDGTNFSGQLASFIGTDFPATRVSFRNAHFDSDQVVFNRTSFTGSTASFDGARFSADSVSFDAVRVGARSISFNAAQLEASWVSFGGAFFTGPFVSFDRTRFTGDQLTFDGAHFTGKRTSFNGADVDMRVATFAMVHFTGGQVSFAVATFQGRHVSFDDAYLIANVITNAARFDVSSLSLNRAITTSTRDNFAALVGLQSFEDDGAKFEMDRADVPECLDCTKASAEEARSLSRPRVGRNGS